MKKYTKKAGKKCRIEGCNYYSYVPYFSHPAAKEELCFKHWLEFGKKTYSDVGRIGNIKKLKNHDK